MSHASIPSLSRSEGKELDVHRIVHVCLVVIDVPLSCPVSCRASLMDARNRHIFHGLGSNSPVSLFHMVKADMGSFMAIGQVTDMNQLVCFSPELVGARRRSNGSHHRPTLGTIRLWLAL